MALEAPHQITPIKELFGVSDQNVAPTLVTVTMYKRGASTVINSGTAALNIQSMDLAQFAGSELTPDGLGSPSQLVVFAEGISCKLSVVPTGSTLDDTAGTGVLLAASVPPKGAYVKIANAPVMAFGPFEKTAHNNGGAFNTVHWQVQGASLKFGAGARGTIELDLMC